MLYGEGNWLRLYAAPGVAFEVHGVAPPDRYLSPLTEFRCAAHVIRNALQAQEQGYDAFVIGHFQEPGLADAAARWTSPWLAWARRPCSTPARWGGPSDW